MGMSTNQPRRSAGTPVGGQWAPVQHNEADVELGLTATGPIVTEFPSGVREWRQDGKLHRTDGPAIEYADGGKEYYVNGSCHREDGPAVEWADGTRMYYVNDELHRTDGPAVERADGNVEYWVNGKQVQPPAGAGAAT